MRIVRVLAAVMALLMCCAMAEDLTTPVPTPEPEYAPAGLTREEIHEFIELLFAAAVGTDVEHETLLREAIMEPAEAAKGTERAEEAMAEAEAALAELNEANADYRARTMPWLISAFMPVGMIYEPEPEISVMPDMATPEPTPEPTPGPTGEIVEELPVYLPEDGYEAFSGNRWGGEYLARLREMGGEDMEKSLLITQEICEMWMEEVDHERLFEMNGHYRAWIFAPATQIDYPVVQSEDNSHYLKRMFNGERNSAGTLFIDYRNLPDFRDPNTLIYGHHMRNDSMFGTLTDYVEQGYYEGHPVMLMMTEEKVFLLEIFAGYTTTEHDHCYDIAISDEEDMAAFIEEARIKSDFDSAAPVNTTDRMVTLSTCAYAFEDARYILIGRIVPVWDYSRPADAGQN